MYIQHNLLVGSLLHKS